MIYCCVILHFQVCALYWPMEHPLGPQIVSLTTISTSKLSTLAFTKGTSMSFYPNLIYLDYIQICYRFFQKFILGFRSQTINHLFCTLISENQGLEKLRSILNLRKISGPAELNFFSVHLSFFSVCHLDFFRFMV